MCLNTQKYFNGYEFKSDVTKLFENFNIDIWRATTNNISTLTQVFWNPLTNSCQNNCLSPWMLKSFTVRKKVPAKWLNSLNCVVNKVNNTKSSMTDMKPKNAIKLDIIQLGKSKTYPEENEIPKDIFYRYLHQPSEQHGYQKRRAAHFLWSKSTDRLSSVYGEPIFGSRFLLLSRWIW